VVMVWCASTEVFITPAGAPVRSPVEKAMEQNDPHRARRCCTPNAGSWKTCHSRTALPTSPSTFPRSSAWPRSAAPDRRKDFKTAAMMKTVLAPRSRTDRSDSRLVLDQYSLGNRTANPRRSRIVQDEGGIPSSGARVHPAAGPVSRLYGNVFHKVRINYYPPAATTRRVGQHRHLRMARLSDADQGRLLCRDSILAAPIVSTWRCSRPGAAGTALRDPGVAVVLLQEPQTARAVS